MKRVRSRTRNQDLEGTAARVEPVGQRGFGWALAVAAVAHVVIIVLLVAGMRHRAEPPMEWVELMPEGVLAGGVPLPEATKEETQPSSPMPVEQPPPAPKPDVPPAPPMDEPEPKPVPAPVPEPKPADRPAPKPEPKVAPKLPEPVPQPKPPPKKKEPMKVSLKEVARPSSGKPERATAAAPVPKGSAVDAAEVRDRLQRRLGKMGVSGATAEGPSGVVGGTATGEIAAYFALIRDVYYRAWRQPGIPGRERLDAVVRVKIARDGKVLGAAIERGSGDAAMDDSVRAATAVVGEIGRPLPDGLGSQFAEVTITFEF